jgi:hypothetical protein
MHGDKADDQEMINTMMIDTKKNHKSGPYESSSQHWGHKGRRKDDLDDDQTVFTPTKSSTDTPIKEDHKTMGVEDLSTPCSTVMGRASSLWTPSAIVA